MSFIYLIIKIVYFKLIFYITYIIMESLYKFNININKKNKHMINDIIRMVTIQVMTQFLFVMNKLK